MKGGFIMLENKEYDFLKTDERLKNNIILLTYGGSLAYGTNTETSDIDVRGIALNSKREILTGNYQFEQVIETNTDTTIYSFKKFCDLLVQCNPNTIEILGCKPEEYFMLTETGRLLIENSSIFLSKRVADTFSGYARGQLTRLLNKANRFQTQPEREKKILESMQRAMDNFKMNFGVNTDDFMLYIDDSTKEGFEKEIYCDINLSHVPVRDFNRMMRVARSVVLDFDHFGFRNTKAIQKNKLGKHMMHLVRLYMMGMEILETGEIHTYREKEHDLLMEIRNGKYLDEKQMPTVEFYELCEELNQKFEKAKQHSVLPDEPDLEKIDDFICAVNERIVG